MGDNGIELSDLSGTGTDPTELRLYSNVQQEAPGAIELLELKTVELPGSELVRTVVPIPSEIPEPTPWGPGSKIQPFEIEEPQSVQIQNLRDYYGTGESPFGSYKTPVYKGKAGKLKGEWPEAGPAEPVVEPVGVQEPGAAGQMQPYKGFEPYKLKYEGRLTTEADLLEGGGMLDEPLLPGGVSLIEGAEELMIEGMAGTVAMTGIGLAFFIFQTLWQNAQDKYTDELRSIGLTGHEEAFWEFQKSWGVPSLDEGGLGYGCKFWEWIPYEYGASYEGSGKKQVKSHRSYWWGDPNIWLPCEILDHYDILYNVKVTMLDGSTRVSNIYIWDFLWLKTSSLTAEQKKDYVPLLKLQLRLPTTGSVAPSIMISVPPKSAFSDFADFGYMLRVQQFGLAEDGFLLVSGERCRTSPLSGPRQRRIGTSHRANQKFGHYLFVAESPSCVHLKRPRRS